MSAKLVSLNIFAIDNEGTKFLLNKTGVPVLYYWDGESDMSENFLNNDKFREIIDMECFNMKFYSKSEIGYFLFEIDGDNEKYNDKFLNIQDIFALDKMTDIENMFYIEYIKSILDKLYVMSMGKEYVGDLLEDENDKFIRIYNEIQEKYPNRFIKTTFVNYVRSELLKTYELNQQNTEWIINKLEYILKDQN